MKVLYRAHNVVQREALIHQLYAAGIKASTNASDVVVQYSSEPSVALQGYSALYEGYAIFVHEEEFTAAELVLKKFLLADVSTEVKNTYFVLFVRNAVFGLMMPFFAPFATYFFIRSLMARERMPLFKLLVGLILTSLSWLLLYFMASQIVQKFLD